jgi:molecular chaperone DnaK (HSP70)
MASRSAPEVPKRPAPRPTSTTSNGSDLPETSANKLRSSFLDLDLLGDDDEYEEPPPRPKAKPQDAPRPRTSTDSRDGSHKLVIAIDYGTTFTGIGFLLSNSQSILTSSSGVAFATPKSAEASLADIRVIDNWGKQMDNDPKVPSVISYSPNSNDEQQWGKSLGPDSVAMINTKLELDVQDNKTDELELILAALEGMGNLNFQQVRASRGYPEYTGKSAEEIVTDFLSKIYQVVDREMNQFGTALRAQLPVDIVITVPVVS